MKHKYITKCNYEKSKGYWLRVPEIKNGVIVPNKYQSLQKFFRKGTGTWKAALEQALFYRDGYLKEHNCIHYLETRNSKNNRKPRHNFKTNASGIIGVRREHTHKASGTYYRWGAFWRTDNKFYSRTFSINRYGEKEAFLMACKIRHKNAGVLIITDKKVLPCLPEQEYVIK